MRIIFSYFDFVQESVDVSEFGARLSSAFSSRRFRLAKVLKTFKNMQTLSLELSEDAVEFVSYMKNVSGFHVHCII